MRYSRLAFVLAAAAMLAGCDSGFPGGPAMGPSKTAAVSGSGDIVAPATVEERMLDEPTRRVLRLTNGLTIILEQNKTAPVAAARVYVKAGALTEQKWMAAGLSHVVEHLVAGATSGKRKEAENTLLLLQIGNDSNAYTDADQTCYFITTSADKLPTAIDLLVDWTTDADFTRAEFNREFKVVQREIEMDEAEADRIFYQHTQVTRYIESPARHPVVGYKAAFQTLTYEDAKAYYKEMYVPDNMIISLAGDFDLDKTEAMVINHLKDIRRKIVPSVALPAEPPVAVPRWNISRADIKQARVNWAYPTTDLYSPDLYATDVLAQVLGGGDASILVHSLRDQLNLVAAIECDNPTPRYVQGELDITAVLDPANLPAAQDAVMKALADVVQNGVAAEEVDRAKAQAAAMLVFGNQTAEQQAIRNALDFMATDNINFTADYVKHIQAVTPEQVQAVAKNFISRDKLLTTIVLPNDAKDPFAPAAAATTNNVAANVPVKKIVLKNGLTLLVSRNTAAPLASFNLYSMGGLLAEDAKDNGIGAAMMDLMTRGTTTRSHEDIAKFLDGTGTTLTSESGNNSFYLNMQCLKDKAPAAFALFADLALHPAFSGDELKKIRDPLLAAIDEDTEGWYGEAYKATKEQFYASSPYRLEPVGKADVIKDLTAEQIRTHYTNNFLDPQKMVLSISGDIDPAAAEAWAAPFGDIPQRSATLDTTSTLAPPATHTLHTDKASATIMLAYPGMKVTGPDRHALILLQTYLGGYSSPGGSVLFEKLRGTGLVYTVSAADISGTAGGMFLISAQGEPQNVQPIIAQIQAIVESVKKGNLPDNLLAAARDQAITGEKLEKQTIADKASAEALDELLGLGWDDSEKFPAQIQAVTKEQVIAAANKYLTTPTIVIMTPEEKK